MTQIMIDESICCTNTDIYFGKKGLHTTTDKTHIGKKCPFCDGIFVKKEYWIDKKNLKIKIIKMVEK